jgi:hypothetical protein
LSGLEAESLIKLFSEQEIKAALDDMKTNSAPGPDGLPVEFYKCFSDQVREPVMKMFKKFYVGDLNLSRLNYGLISLIPKLK